MFTVEEGLLGQDEFLEKVSSQLDSTYLIKTNKKIEYYNVPAGFDIEVSTFYDGEKIPENKRACMYIWQFGIYKYVTTGRTWGEFRAIIEVLKTILNLSDERRLVVYVHNLPYEFQFIRKHFDWEEVFILSDRKPVYANAHGIEFRCSLKLAGGKSLENVGKDLQKYKVAKLVGNLDYNLLRTPRTPLSEKELLYCENDIRVILSYIQEKIETDGDITKIPLTNTGYVRNYCRKECYRRWKKYREIMEVLTVEPDEYSQLKRAFQGGFTHANARHARKVLKNVGSHDFTSSYPAVMLLEKFPMSKAKVISGEISEEEFTRLLLAKCCLFDVEIWGLIPILYQEHPISSSKCYLLEDYVVDNGRVVFAGHLKTTITEQDYFVYLEFYDWDRIAIHNLRVYEKNYLPKAFALSLLELYKRKTQLKGVDGEEINYMISKNMMNAAFGMSVTDPVRKEIRYENDEFISGEKNIEESIERYNSNIKRFLFYPWGVWVTAYARSNLFSGIIAVGDDYVYSDTDSIKTLNTEAHAKYFERYNQQILEKIKRSAEYYKVSEDEYSPVNKNGKPKTIGIWDDEGIYDKFKTLGAKRYLTFKKSAPPGHQFVLTLAGANKRKSMEYLIELGKPFEAFDDSLTIPPDKSGRLVLTYIDFETEGDIVDYLGIPYHYNELSSVAMEPSEYSLSISEGYIKYLEGLVDFSE